jgi:hypothetical protein
MPTLNYMYDFHICYKPYITNSTIVSSALLENWQMHREISIKMYI